MGKTDKEISKKRWYYIPGERQMELEHFCRQYDDWVDNCYICVPHQELKEVRSTDKADPTYWEANRQIILRNRIEIVNKAVEIAISDFDFSTDYEKIQTKALLLLNITRGYSWTENAPGVCARTKFYKLRRRFFWWLDKFRD